ncbi:MAG: SRPBCC domain-containing protein [Anaerolineales bacterium]|nr:SRPBCC domain-containing protein [Anaerolineales bacterium]
MDKVLHRTVRIGCNTERAFEMFTDNKLLASWFPPEADVEPVVGGKYELFWDPEDKENNSTIGCKVTAVEPGKLVAFEWKGPVQFKEFMNEVDPLTHVVVVFIPFDEGQNQSTEVHVIHSGWRSTDRWEEARQFFEWAWDEELKELKEAVDKE